MYVASVKWVFQVMGDGRRFWLEGVELGRAKVESVEEVVARITEEAVDRGAEWEKRRRVRVRMIARIRVGGRDGENSTAYYAYVDGERYVLSKKHLLLRVAGARGCEIIGENIPLLSSIT